MKLPKLYYEIDNNKQLKDDLEKYCDFILQEPSKDTKSEAFYSNEELILIGSAGSGDSYWLIVKDNKEIEDYNILYVSTDGEYAIVADSFNELMLLITSYPFWTDIIRMTTDNINLDELIESLQQEIVEDIPNYLNILSNTRKKLDLVKDKDILKRLFNLINKKDIFPLYSIEDNNEYEALVLK